MSALKISATFEVDDLNELVGALAEFVWFAAKELMPPSTSMSHGRMCDSKYVHSISAGFPKACPPMLKQFGSRKWKTALFNYVDQSDRTSESQPCSVGGVVQRHIRPGFFKLIFDNQKDKSEPSEVLEGQSIHLLLKLRARSVFVARNDSSGLTMMSETPGKDDFVWHMYKPELLTAVAFSQGEASVLSERLGLHVPGDVVLVEENFGARWVDLATNCFPFVGS
jgi:hypothetical protein